MRTIPSIHWAFRFHLLEKEGIGKSRDIHENRTLLTFLNIRQLERQGADILSKVNELEEVNQSLRERDKNKDDAITMLSNQLLTITETKGIENKNF